MSRVLRLDMHVHTRCSHDGREPPKRMVERAAQIGLDGLAITDHNTQEGVGEALEAGEDLGVTVVPGVEVSCSEGHVLVYGCDELDLEAGQGVGTLLEYVEGSFPECIAAPAHPFDFYRSGMGWRARRYNFQAVETVNAHSLLPRSVVLPLARSLNVGEVGGSDTHFLGGIGMGRTIVDCEGQRLLSEISRTGRAEGGFHPWGILLPRLRRSRG